MSQVAVDHADLALIIALAALTDQHGWSRALDTIQDH